jgi:hypothetical protein
MRSVASQTEVASEPFDTIQFETHLKDHDDCAELIEIIRSANELVRLARALVPRELAACFAAGQTTNNDGLPHGPMSRVPVEADVAGLFGSAG